MFCNQCGKKNPGDAKFCNACGASIGEVQDIPKDHTNDAKTPGKILTSLILGILSLVFLFIANIFIGLLLGIMGMIFGLIGMKELSNSEQMGMARFAVICNFVSIIITLIIFMFQPA